MNSRYIDGECNENEICVETPLSIIAHCVNVLEMAKSATLWHGNTETTISASQVGLPALGGGTSAYSVQTIVTGRDYHQFVNATVLTVSAQKSQLINGHQLWQTLPNGKTQCNDCAALGMGHVPEGTERFALDVELPQSVIEGVVHLASWIP